jgi:nitrate reductase alpha subunit
VKYPYVRGALLDIWREAKKKYEDPVEAWASIQADPKLRSRYQRARGKGGFRRVGMDEAMEIASAANVHTARKYGPDRVAGFSPIPAMSMLSHAAGCRFLQLFGGVNLSFYDWYSDLPPASPEVWGEQTDVAESADWYHSKMIAVMGSASCSGPRIATSSPRPSTTGRSSSSSRPTSRRSASTRTNGSPCTPGRTAPFGWRSATSS